jgi:hypothetical protein
MIIYTSNADGDTLQAVKNFGLGIMIASSASWNGQNKEWRSVPCALDNGAFQCWKRGFPFMEEVFLNTLKKAYVTGVSLNFIVAPDIVAGGRDSLDFSMEWATGKLKTAPCLALAVQDGMTPKDLMHHNVPQYFTHLFVGGTVKWKWETAESWVKAAHGFDMECHIGRCGKIENLRRAQSIGADSVDSASFARNNSWHIISEFMSIPNQLELEVTDGEPTTSGSEEEDQQGRTSKSGEAMPKDS